MEHPWVTWEKLGCWDIGSYLNPGCWTEEGTAYLVVSGSCDWSLSLLSAGVLKGSLVVFGMQL